MYPPEQTVFRKVAVNGCNAFCGTHARNNDTLIYYYCILYCMGLLDIFRSIKESKPKKKKISDELLQHMHDLTEMRSEIARRKANLKLLALDTREKQLLAKKAQAELELQDIEERYTGGD
jgi:hypothetical protein